jgi:hypothetical protein
MKTVNIMKANGSAERDTARAFMCMVMVSCAIERGIVCFKILFGR